MIAAMMAETVAVMMAATMAVMMTVQLVGVWGIVVPSFLLWFLFCIVVWDRLVGV